MSNQELEIIQFQLSKEETEILKSQNVTSSWDETYTLPIVFTEKYLYMHATILKINMVLAAKMQHFGKVLSDIVMPDLETSETESTLELNFIIGKIKHTVKRIKKSSAKIESEEDGL